MTNTDGLTLTEALARAKKAAKRGNKRLAADLYRAVLQQQPGHPVAKKALRKLEGKRPGAARAAAPAGPTQAELDAIIANLTSGHMQRAELDSRALLERFPEAVLVMNLLGVALQRQGKAREAVDVLDRAIELAPGFAEAYDNRGIALKAIGDYEASIESFDKAIAINSRLVNTQHNRANALKELGRFDAAKASYESAIRLAPGFAAAHLGLASIKRFDTVDDQLRLMLDLFDGRTGGLTDRAELSFALAKAYEDLGDVDRSFEFLKEGNRVVDQRRRYGSESDRQLFDRLRGVAWNDLAVASDATREPLAQRPIFIVGMVRSGTSLVEQILASHPDVHGAGELEAMNQLVAPYLADTGRLTPGLTDIRGGYSAALDRLGTDAAVVSDKMPPNFRWIGFIAAALPEAKIVHVVRDPMATCWSIYKHYFPDEGHGYAYSFENLAAYYHEYTSLMAYWHETLPGKILDLSYEALTEDQEAETRCLLDYCGLDWDPACLDFHKTDRPVRTLSASQVRQKVYTGSSESWRTFGKHLDVLQDHLDGKV